VKKRRPLAKLIRDLARPGDPTTRGGRTSGAANAAPVSARKPPARIESGTGIVVAAPRRLIDSPIMQALTKAARVEGRRRRVPSRPSRRSSRAS
jgi:hypothetical protein